MVAATMVNEAKQNIIKARPAAFQPKVPANDSYSHHLSVCVVDIDKPVSLQLTGHPPAYPLLLPGSAFDSLGLWVVSSTTSLVSAAANQSL